MKNLIPYPDPEGKRLPRVRVDWSETKIRFEVFGRITFHSHYPSPSDLESVGYSHGYLRDRFWVSNEPTHKLVDRKWSSPCGHGIYHEVDRLLKPITRLRMNTKSNDQITIADDEGAINYSQPITDGPGLVESRGRLRGVLWIPKKGAPSTPVILRKEFIDEQGFWASSQHQYMGNEAMTGGNVNAVL